MAIVEREFGTLPVNRGPYNDQTDYYKDNLVQFQDCTHYCKVPGPIRGIDPTDTTKWGLFSGTENVLGKLTSLEHQECELSAKVSACSNQPFIVKNFVCNNPSGEQTEFKPTQDWDMLMIRVLDGVTRINVSGATLSTSVQLGEDIWGLDKISVPGVNCVLDPRAKWVCCNLNKSANPSGYIGIKIEQIGNRILRNDDLDLFADADYAFEEKAETLFHKTLSAAQSVAQEGKGVLVPNWILNNPSSENAALKYTEEWDCLLISILNGVDKVKIEGANYRATTILGSLNPLSIMSVNSGLGTNEFNIPQGGRWVIVNLKKYENPDGYDNMQVSQFSQGEIIAPEIIEEKNYDPVLELLEAHVVVYKGKNLLNPDEFIPYYISSGSMISGGRSSNKLILENGCVYTISNAMVYTTGRIVYGVFDAEDNLLGVRYAIPANLPSPLPALGTASFTFNGADVNGTPIAYSRVVIATSNEFDNNNIVQLEKGGAATEYEHYQETTKLDFDQPTKRQLRILCIGSSFSGDMLNMVPYVFREMVDDIDLKIGYLYYGGCTFEQSNQFFDTNASEYKAYIYEGGDSWRVQNNWTIKQMLDYSEWDLMLVNQGANESSRWNTFQPHLNQFLNRIINYVDHPLRFVFMQVPSAPYFAVAEGYDQAKVETQLANIWQCCHNVLDTSLCDDVIPCGTAIQNARGTILNNLGAGGNLTAERLHLQAGLPEGICAYVVVGKLLEYCGYGYKSIIGHPLRFTPSWYNARTTAGPNGSCQDATDEEHIIAQKCAVMALKKPYEITDMASII